MKKRNLNLDLIRSIAVISVIAVHFFLNTGFYEEPIKGIGMESMITIRSIFMISVPLFLLLTGYLMKNKRLNKKYYSGIIKVITTYIVISIFTIVFRKIYLKESITFFAGIKSIFDFTGNPYAWYIEMYIGLFLLIPFLNMIWRGLEKNGQKKMLILTAIVLTTIPTLTNIGSKFLPDWWSNLYPITYYYLGSYFSEMGEKSIFKKVSTIPNILVVIAINGAMNIILNYDKIFEWRPINDWNGLQNVILASMIFVYIDKQKLSFSRIATHIIKKISELSLGIYLSSYIFDSIIYGVLNKKITKMDDKLHYSVAIVIAVFIGSFLLSYIESIINKQMNSALGKLEKPLNKRILEHRKA